MIVFYPKTYKRKRYSEKCCTVECIKNGPSREWVGFCRVSCCLIRQPIAFYPLYCGSKIVTKNKGTTKISNRN